MLRLSSRVRLSELFRLIAFIFILLKPLTTKRKRIVYKDIVRAGSALEVREFTGESSIGIKIVLRPYDNSENHYRQATDNSACSAALL